ncbi:TPA: DUF3969 family protein [Escherichia coli]
MNAASHSKNLIDIIDSGCELEDISSIIPENLSGNIDKLINQTLILFEVLLILAVQSIRKLF